MKITRRQLRKLISEAGAAHGPDHPSFRDKDMVRRLFQALDALRGVTPEDIDAGLNSGTLGRIQKELRSLANGGLIWNLQFWPNRQLIPDGCIISFNYGHPKIYIHNSLKRYSNRNDDMELVPGRMSRTHKLFLSETTITYRIKPHNMTIYMSKGENHRL